MSAARPILIVEDDAALRQILAEQMAASGLFTSVEAATLDEANRHLTAPDARFDTIILDVNLPDGDGRDFCARLRKQGFMMPVIMVTGTAANEEDIVNGLNAGANDYIAKPFRAKELFARLTAQLRAFDNSESAVFTIGPYEFNPAAKLLTTKKGVRIRMTAKEVDILKFLYRSQDRIVTRRMLLDEVWGYNSDVATHTLETHIYRLRQKMEPDASNCCMLMTAPGGYRLAV